MTLKTTSEADQAALANRQKATAEAIRAAGVPDILNRFLPQNSAALAADNKVQAMPKASPKSDALRAMREAKANGIRKPKVAELTAAMSAFRGAVHFTATIFKDGGYLTEQFADLAGARAARAALEKKAANGRKALVYAVSANGMTDLIPDWFSPPAIKADQPKPKQESASQTETTTVKRATSKTTKAKARSGMKPSAKTSGKTSGNPKSRSRYDWSGAAEAAKSGKLPTAPDFSAPTHERFRDHLQKVATMAKAGDLNGLRKFKIPAHSSSPKAVMRYRDLVITALQAKAS